MLATTCEKVSFNQEQQEEISDAVELAAEGGIPEGGLAEALHELAADESKAAFQLVGRFHVLLDKHRLRHRYEPTGIERRRLRRTIAISRYTLKLRRIGTANTAEDDRKIAWYRAMVRVLHLGFWRSSAGWNAHYNAGCFYALLYSRELNLLLGDDGNANAEPPDGDDPTGDEAAGDG